MLHETERCNQMVNVTVAMATFNGEAYLREQLDSIAAQTHPPDQIVISDDGSTDRTIPIAEAWSTHHDTITVTILPGSGPGNYSGNFIRAFHAATGHLVFPCDQDDVWLPEKIETMMDLMTSDPTAMVGIHDVEITDENLKPKGARKMDMSQAIGGPMKAYNPGMASVIRGPFLACCLEPAEGFTYDNWIHHCARALNAKRLVDIPLALYRQHGSNSAQAEFVNSGAGENRISRKAKYAFRVLKSDRGIHDLEREQSKTEASMAWLKAMGTPLTNMGFSKATLDAHLAQLEAHVALIQRRISIRQKTRILRLLPVLALMRRRGYAQFGGLYSAAKDILT